MESVLSLVDEKSIDLLRLASNGLDAVVVGCSGFVVGTGLGWDLVDVGVVPSLGR